jgi:dihydroflavonol-4-reductase
LLGRFSTDGMRTVCDVRDVADGHLAAALRGRSGERYVLSGEAMSVRELLGAIADEMGTKPPVLTLPPSLVVGVARAAEAVATLTGRAPTLSVEMAIQSCLRVVISPAKAERELGYRHRPARDSIRDTVAFHRERGTLGEPASTGAA